MATKNIRKEKFPVFTRAAAVQPETLDREKRTFEVIFTTGARVLRRGFFEDFFEELSLEKSHVRMGRLQNGAPFLDSHGFGEKRGVRNQLGVIEKAKLIPKKEGRATVRMSKRAEVEDIFNDIEDGILRNISVGYNIFRFEKTEAVGEVDVFRATDWEPVEISLVVAGADDGAKVRSDNEPMNDCVIVDNRIAENNTCETDLNNADNIRSQSQNETVEKPQTENETVENPETLRDTENTGEIQMTEKEIKDAKEKAAKEAREQGIVDEKKRQLEIRSTVKKVSLDEKLATQYIDENKTVEEVRTLVIDALAEKDKNSTTETRAAGGQVEVGTDNARVARIAGMTSAILHRFRPKSIETRDKGQKVILPGHELIDQGREFAYFSLIDMARHILEANGVRTGMMPKHVLADQALLMRSLHSISDFPEILANVANKTLRDGYLAAPITWKPFTSEVFVPDFKEISRTNLGDADKLEKLEEGSEVKRGSISEAAEKYRVEEFAKIITLSRKVIVNDDLGAFTRVPERLGRRASDLESDTLWDIIKDNAALSDTFALFSSQHGNLSTSPAVPSEGGLSEARKLMRRQVGLNGAEISLTPVWFYVPPELETAAEKLIASIVPDSSTNVSPFSSAGRTPLRLDVEPRLETGTNGSLDSWFIFADVGQVDMLELARLEGSDGPQIQTRDGFEVNGVEIKIMHDIGAKAIEHRGLFKNAGA